MTFTLTEVMDAVKDAFARVGGETARDCVVEQTVRETLSARHGAESGPRQPKSSREKDSTNPPGRHSTL